jgi:putative salt-induced outer membrane protein YdiY
MRSRKKKRVSFIPVLSTAALALALAGAIPSAASAQDPAPEEKPTKLTADLAFIQTDGNTEVTTISGGEKIEHKLTKWAFLQEARAVWGETDGVETAGRYDATLRGDYLLSSRLSTYAIALWRRNVFAGISRQFEEGLGLSWHAVTGKPHVLDLEAGGGLLQRHNTTDTDDEFATARVAVLYQYHFTEKAYFEARGVHLLGLEDSDDSQSEARLALLAPLGGAFSLKLGYDLYYRKEPLPGLEDLDTTLSAGLQFVR